MAPHARQTLDRGLAIAMIACVACAHPAVEPPQPLAAVPAARLARLARTANVTRWFNGRDSSQSHLRNYLSDSDFEVIRGLGFGSVRLAIDLRSLFHPATPDAPDPTILSYLDLALDRMLAHHLAVIVDLQPIQPDRRLETDPSDADAFVRFWAALARHLSRRDPDSVFLEVLNEPVFQGRAGHWLRLQAQVVAAIRREAPAHTIIATGPGWSTVDGLLGITPVADPNVVYTFHFYEPFAFTHQGASWVSTVDARLHGVPYPTEEPNCGAAARAQTDSGAARALRAYCAHGWDAQAVDRRLTAAEEWGRRHSAPVFLGEFGVYRAVAPPVARAAWIRDVRTAAERLGIGWAIWGFDDALGLAAVRASDGRLVLDSSVVRALGLPPAEGKLSSGL